jgi:hypothetical protein
MNRRIIANHLIEAFAEYTPKEQMEMTKTSEIVKDTIIKYYGVDKWNELYSAEWSDWSEAYKIFEQHHGVFNHGDYEQLMSK